MKWWLGALMLAACVDDREPPALTPDAGSATLLGSFNVCPRPDAWSATPAVLPIGAVTTIRFLARDRDGDSVSYSWSALDGSFSAPYAADTDYTCASEGDKALTVTFSDGPARGCRESATVHVTCTR